MNIIRLGDRIEELQRPMPLGKSYAAAEYLAQKVFNPSPDRKDIEYYFIQSKPLSDNASFMEMLPSGTPVLGEYEVKITGKLLDPQRPVLVIVGPLGSGKSTLKNYVALHLLQNRNHCERCKLPRQRLIASIDFNEHTNLNSFSESSLNRELYRILCDELQSRLKLAGILSESDEFHTYWKQQIDEYREQKSSSMSFRYLISRSQNPGLLNFNDVDNKILHERKLLFERMSQNPELLLDYLVRLWRFVIEIRLCGSHGCGFVLLDNLDKVYPTVQRKVVDLVHTHARINGPTFMILVRPETFDIAGLGTGIIDVENHVGPSPFEVITDHLKKFLTDPDSYYSADAGLAYSQFEILVKFFGGVQQIISEDTHQVFSKFMDNLCGKSIRIGHLVAQQLFYASRADMTNASLNAHDLVRLCIRGDAQQLTWKLNGVIEHLFRVSTQNSNGMLIKPRILRYLGRSTRERRKFGEIHNVMTGFGYENSIITDAINDLMNVNHQLVRSNGFDFYGDRDLLISAGDNLRLTEIGKGYSNYLIGDLDYVQEIMLDTYVDGDHFPQTIGFNYLIDKFRIVHRFLDEIRKIDRQETEQFIEKWGHIPYRDAFGDHLIALDIIHGVYPSVMRILRKHAPNFDRTELISDFKSLVLSVEHDNKTVIGVDVESIAE